MRDSRGGPIIQAPLHRLLHAHVEWAHARGLHAGVVAPWGHGKTEQIVVCRTLHRLGHDPNLRIKIVCNNDPNAMARVQAIKQYVEVSEELHLVFPDLGPLPGGDWGKHKLMVRRPGRSKDASVEAWGIFGGGTGGRADELIFDDVPDFADIVEPRTREKKIQALHNVWMSRLVAGGHVTYLATAWHDQDLTHQLVQNRRWSFLWAAVSEDYERIDITVHNADGTHPVLHSGVDDAANPPRETGGG